ncbi:MAG: class I SAM-dependent methyltransferase [Candidatus Accumulibacter sp.]|jgi:SAM-dependent methyltransferase|nr:class I SAM-dependent methyltransferase [Accumulibacter sp.]
MNEKRSVCPVCGGTCPLLDVVDFNKSCEDGRGRGGGDFNLAGIPVYYVRCVDCGFCFAPEFSAWSPEEFKARIYNDEYVLVDPDYTGARPRLNAASLLSMFPGLPESVRHLDYGGGDSLLVNILRESNWNSVSYDPLVDGSVDAGSLGNFDLITAFEVFEHVPDVQKLISDLCRLLVPGGIVLFSTVLSDGHIHARQRLNWWYASPRNGHISLFSRKSLSILARSRNLIFGSFSEGFHTFFTSVPSWANHIIRS